MTGPVLSGPAGLALPALPVGITLADPFAATNPGQLNLRAACTHGTLAVAVSGLAVTGNGTAALDCAPSWPEAVAALASLAYTPPWPVVADTIVVTVYDQAGKDAVLSLAFGAPVPPPPEGALSTPAVVPPPPGTSVLPMVTARRAHDFSAMVAVNTHLDFGVSGATPQYADLVAVAGLVNLIWGRSGVAPLLRDCPGANTDPALWGTFSQLCTPLPAYFIAYIGETEPAGYAPTIANALAMGHLVVALEGPDEPDTAAVNLLTGGLTAAAAMAAAAAYMPTLWATGQMNDLPVINLSFGQGWTAANDWQGDYGAVGNLAAVCTYANAHTYPGALPPAATIAALNADALLAAPGRPVATTEFGYLSTIGLDVQARFLLAGLCDAFQAGAPVCAIYALLDDMSGAWGLADPSGVLRPAGTALATLLALLADLAPGAASFAPGSLGYAAPGCASELLQCADGSFRLLLWAEAPLTTGADPTVAVPLSLATAMTIAVYDPLSGTDPLLTASGTTLAIPVPVSPLVVALHPV